MSKDTVSDWSTTPASNTDVGGVDLAENSMRPRDVNNAIRTMMAQLKTFLGGTVPGFLDGILTTRGDILRRGATTSERYALGTTGYALKSDGTDAVWAPDREVLSANRTYYVRKDGSDSNTGLADTSGGAFLTIQKAVDIAGGLDLSIYNVTITVRADGGTPYASVLLKTLVGAGGATISGDTTTPSNVGITTSTASTDAVNADGIKGSWTLEGVKFTTTGSGRHGVNVTNSRVNFGVVDFGACISNQLSVSQAGLAVFNANYSITGGAAIHWDARIGSIIQCVGRTITITGTPAFSTAFCSATKLSMANVPSNTFSGSATGTRYTGSENSVVYSNAAGATYLPGNAAGSTATGGQYI